jgi:hypothetical protein
MKVDGMAEDRSGRIAAWLDGLMTDAEVAAFQAEMEGDPALAETVRQRLEERHLRDLAPTPSARDDLMAKFGLGEAKVIDFAAAKAAKAKRDKAEAALRRPPSALKRQLSEMRWRLPAFGLIAALVITVIVVSRPPSGLEGQVEFQMALQSLPSNSSQGLRDSGVVSPRVSFTAGDGRYCREFAIEARGETTKGIACKGDRLWSVEALSKAGEEDRVIDSAYARLKTKAPISEQREKDLIAADWK